VTYVFVNLKGETIGASELEVGEGDRKRRHEELMPGQGGTRGQPGPSKAKGREGEHSDKKESPEGTSEKSTGPERPRSCGEPIIAPSSGEGGPRQNILLGAELASYDEVKVWTEEGEEESEMTCSERLQAELQDDPGGGPPLIPIDPPEPPPSPREQDLTGKSEPSGSPYTPPGFLGLPYPGYPPPPHIGRGGSPLSPFLYPDHLGSPPPAHMGSLPYNLDPNKGPVGFRTYPFSSQYGGYPVLPPDLTTWSEGVFPYMRHGVPPFLPGHSLASAISRFSASGLFSGGGFGSPPLSPPHGMGGISLINQVKLEPGLEDKKGKKKPHIKKPLNAFMLYMKEMRPKVVAECTLKESAAINQILGRKWHALTREEQAKYYEQARKERQLHMQMYPGWSARDNYAQTKEPKKKRKREKTQDTGGFLYFAGNPLKKCRARWGLEQTDLWCKPCKPEEAIDGVGDSTPLYHVPHGGPHNGGPLLPGENSPLSLVTISEPLLDLRSFGGPNGCGVPQQCQPNHEPSDINDQTNQSPKYICL